MPYIPRLLFSAVVAGCFTHAGSSTTLGVSNLALQRRLDGELTSGCETCRCGGSSPWTAESQLPYRATGIENAGHGRPSGKFGGTCTTVGSPTGQPWCWLHYGDQTHTCLDQVRDSGANMLDLWMSSNWYYSYQACECSKIEEIAMPTSTHSHTCSSELETCMCGGLSLWTPSGKIGETCTTVGSPTGRPWCWLHSGQQNKLCSDQVRDSGETKLDLPTSANWSYSYRACECAPIVSKSSKRPIIWAFSRIVPVVIAFSRFGHLSP
eukprot:TRINITY_DN15512_c0_g2_i1.p1 TRINITY_DN15512_c0_g2~~TRINITY_DN15512_c0_g2_i1.p1  ORF type:complete len:278 (+),score=-6.37 TRINITY_DN15512_c0_g2_i1:39-836(+)